MTVLIYSYTPEPTPITLATKEILTEILNDQHVRITHSFNMEDRRSDTDFTLVYPGGYLPEMMTQHGEISLPCRGFQIKKVQEMLDDGANLFGICAGAFYACNKVIERSYVDAQNPTVQHFALSQAVNYLGGTLNRVDAAAAGPFFVTSKPIQAIKIATANGECFDSLYWQGPAFFKSDSSGIYAGAEVLASYQLSSKMDLIIDPNFGRSRSMQSSALTIEGSLPAALKIANKNATTVLVGFHPELACQAPSFLPYYENQYPVANRDVLCSTVTQQKNHEFLEQLVSPFKTKFEPF